MKTIAFALFLCTSFLATSHYCPAQTVAQAATWTKIGEVMASFKLDNESILGSGKDRFKSIRLHVNKDINIKNIEIYYQSGEVEDVVISKLIPENTSTQDFPIRANNMIKKIVFSYKTPDGLENNAVLVELFGRK